MGNYLLLDLTPQIGDRGYHMLNIRVLVSGTIYNSALNFAVNIE